MEMMRIEHGFIDSHPANALNLLPYAFAHDFLNSISFTFIQIQNLRRTKQILAGQFLMYACVHWKSHLFVGIFGEVAKSEEHL